MPIDGPIAALGIIFGGATDIKLTHPGQPARRRAVLRTRGRPQRIDHRGIIQPGGIIEANAVLDRARPRHLRRPLLIEHSFDSSGNR
ncbi:hypothetical protein MSHI_06810 [Mycobacterium shinjukuense]|uniref:Uncharacterized protein n=1 Tax=Mycobacterium shinjukuense TaxID=398694 RepID=A0A7I7MKU6_9MYCO|nr:hypothetical protein MSHI_06810 [Mycobacterium shinjukuense]